MKRWILLALTLIVVLCVASTVYAGRMYAPGEARFLIPDPALNVQNPNELLKLNQGVLCGLRCAKRY